MSFRSFLYENFDRASHASIGGLIGGPEGAPLGARSRVRARKWKSPAAKASRPAAPRDLRKGGTPRWRKPRSGSRATCRICSSIWAARRLRWTV